MAAPSEKRGEVKLTCDDILEFQETLKKLRLLDDRIIHKLNTTIPTDSFAREVNASGQCKELYQELEEAYSSRETAIKKCILQVSTKVSDLRQQRQSNTDDIGMLKDLRKQQSNLRLMQLEVNVEEVIRDRSLKVFYERCRQLYKPPKPLS